MKEERNEEIWNSPWLILCVAAVVVTDYFLFYFLPVRIVGEERDISKAPMTYLRSSIDV